MLHTLAAAYPKKPTEEKKKSFQQLLNSFAENFFCPICGVHMKAHFKQFPLADATENNETIQRYIYDLHESVNKRKGKSQMHTFEEVKQAFDITKPWTTFGGYPILSSKPYIQEQSLENKSLKGEKNQDGMEKVYIIIIVVLSFVLLAIAALGIYFFVKSKSNIKIQ